MWLKYTIMIFIFFILALIQNSFSAYFNIMGNTLNLVFILFFILIFFEDTYVSVEGFSIAVIAGFFLDIFLPFYFGFAIVSFLAVYGLEKTIIYFLKEDRDKYPVFYFIPIFSVCFMVYSFLLYAVSLPFALQATFGSGTFVSLLYNVVFACIGFYLYKKYKKYKAHDNQLRLFN